MQAHMYNIKQMSRVRLYLLYARDGKYSLSASCADMIEIYSSPCGSFFYMVSALRQMPFKSVIPTK